MRAHDTPPSGPRPGSPAVPLLVRPRTGADLDACADVLAAVHAHSSYPANWPADPAGWLSPPALEAAWVAVSGADGGDGAVIGHVVLCRATPDDLAAHLWSERTGTDPSATAVVSRLFVSPAARGRGAGARLLAAAVDAARAAGRHPVLDVLASDTSARALYERLGWRPLGTAGQEWGPGQVVTLHCYAAG
ncbi:GNAT family N-acetyltransferase [Streptomyces sp. NBC_01497]|uniref:GNAT family N-acetyltransferase n=1 Tax=Streptomyces sp. NBC_01497 TaxID=2903885 RepID=UPI002E374154|nr:GNAT family N-acetyltransferase [Streptomyces sp. NBC_01497]